jgi:DNA-binding MarR family transcriptional regulator
MPQKPSKESPPDFSVLAGYYDIPGYLVRRLQQRTQAIFDHEAGRHGLTSAQYATLRIIHLVSDLEQREVAQAVGYDAATVGGILLRLEALGLIERRKGTRSRRGRAVRITTAGVKRIASIQPAIERIQRKLLQPLGPAEQKQLLHLLSKITDTQNSYYRARS